MVAEEYYFPLRFLIFETRNHPPENFPGMRKASAFAEANACQSVVDLLVSN